jgi:pimeloyl-ACP methyl ester carboxylesterase
VSYASAVFRSTFTLQEILMKRFIQAAIGAATFSVAAFAQAAPTKNIVLVHGAFADGSGWKAVADILKTDGFTVSIAQPPETSLEDDVAATNRAIDAQGGPVVLVGHSYGGIIVTAAGNNPHVQSLVYVAALQPDAGESLTSLQASKPPASTAVKPSPDGFLYLDPARFHADFAADLPAATAEFMARSQVALSPKAATAQATNPAWKTKPTFAIVATKDRAINPDLERSMYKRASSKVTEIPASHAVYMSHPAEVAKVIEQAAQ